MNAISRWGQRVRPWLPVAIIAVLMVVAVRWWIKDPRLTLDYLRVLVWPVLVGTVLYWLREPLKVKVGQLLNVTIAGAKAEFAAERLDQELQAGLDSAVEVLQAEEDAGLSAHEEAEVDVAERTESSSTTDQGRGQEQVQQTDDEAAREQEAPTWASRDVAARHNREMDRRRAIEKIIEESAEWGYGMAQIGFAGIPKPVIAWSDDGRPRILYGKSELPALSKPAPGYDPTIKARNIEDEIRRIERDLATDTGMFTAVGSLGSIHRMERERADRKRLAELKTRLRQLDPNSALAD